MCEHAADDIIALRPVPLFRYQGMPGIDPYKIIVGTRGVWILRLPNRPHPDPAGMSVPSGLGSRHIFKISRQKAGRKELSVCYGFTLLRYKLLYFFVIHSCQE
jgi:hypothetical protein